MWKRLSETVSINCPSCKGSGVHSVCGRPGVIGCSCEGTGKCPTCEGNEQIQREGLPWPQTAQEWADHSERHPELINRQVVTPESNPHITFRGHTAESAHDNSDHVHVGFPPRRLKD